MVEFRLRPWGADEDLVALLGEQGAAEFRALFDAFPDPVGVLWALRDELVVRGGGQLVGRPRQETS